LSSPDKISISDSEKRRPLFVPWIGVDCPSLLLVL
jgi:hypothetical protein